jgi:hypothetical protein
MAKINLFHKQSISYTILVLALFFGVNFDVAAQSYSLGKSKLKSLTISGKKITCGLVGTKWQVVTKSGKKYRVKKSAKSSHKKACSKLLSKNALKSLSSLPSTAEIVRSSKSASGKFSLKELSGTPPTLLEIAKSSSLKDIFWNSGVIEGLNSETPSELQCSQFFGSSQDGLSSGMSGCYLTQGIGFSFQNMLQSGTSLCYLKNSPSVENFEADGITVISGELPPAGITAVFRPGNSAKIVKIIPTGFPSSENEGEEEGEGEIFVKIPSTAQNSVSGSSYKVELWFCDGQGKIEEYQITAVSLSGELKTTAAGQFENGATKGIWSSLVKGSLIRSGGRLVFDPSQSRVTETKFSSNEQSFKSSINLTSGNLLYNKTVDVSGENTRKAYSVGRVSGSSIADLRILEGAYRDVNLNGDGGNSEYQSALEYRDSYYSSVESSDLKDDISELNLSSDSYLSGEIEVAFSEDKYDCQSEADLVLGMDLSKPTMQAVSEECEGERIDGMNFCNNDFAVNQANQNFFNYCVDQ